MSSKKQFAVLGLGRFGGSLALALEDMGYHVLGVDRDEAVAANFAKVLTHVVSFDFRDAQTMEKVGIQNFDTVAIAAKNLEASLMATMICKEMGIGEIVVKAIDERHAEMARKLGATNVIFSERDTARRTALHLVSPHAVDHISLEGDISVIGLEAPKKLIGKSLMEAGLRAGYSVNVIAIRRGESTNVTPSPNFVFREGDRLFLVGTAHDLTAFEEAMRIR